MALKQANGRHKRPPFADDSESEGEISANEMPELLLPEKERTNCKFNKDGDAVYEAEEVLAKDERLGYLVKWKGYYRGESTWEPWTNLDSDTKKHWLEKEKRITENLLDKFDVATFYEEEAKVKATIARRLARLSRVAEAAVQVEREDHEDEALAKPDDEPREDLEADAQMYREAEQRKHDGRERLRVQGLRQVEGGISDDSLPPTPAGAAPNKKRALSTKTSTKERHRAEEKPQGDHDRNDHPPVTLASEAPSKNQNAGPGKTSSLERTRATPQAERGTSVEMAIGRSRKDTPDLAKMPPRERPRTPAAVQAERDSNASGSTKDRTLKQKHKLSMDTTPSRHGYSASPAEASKSIDDKVPLKKRKLSADERPSAKTNGDAASRRTVEKASPIKKPITARDLATTTISHKSDASLAPSFTARRPKPAAAPPPVVQAAKRSVAGPVTPNSSHQITKAQTGSKGVNGPIVFKNKLPMKRKPSDEPHMFKTLNHQLNASKKAAARNDEVSAEDAGIFKFVGGERVVEQAPAGKENAAMVDRPRGPGPVKITVPAATIKVAASRNQQHTKPPGFIPLSCPYWADGAPCQRTSGCFFQHSRLAPPRNASYTLFEQAESESTLSANYCYKFGFFKDTEALTCRNWPNCPRNDEECQYAHWLTPRTIRPKSELVCYFWANESTTGRACFHGANCLFLHELRDGCEIAHNPQSKNFASPISPLHQSPNISSDKRKSSTADRLVNEPMPMNVDPGYEVAPRRQAAPLQESARASRRVDYELKLTVHGEIFGVTVSLSPDADEYLGEKKVPSLDLGILAEHAHDFLSLSKPLFFGPVLGIGPTDQFDALVVRLRHHLQGATVSLPRVDLLFVPSNMREWSFLPCQNTKSSLSCYIYQKGQLPDTTGQPLPEKVGGDRDVQIFDVLESAIPGGHKALFKWFNKTLDRNIYLADTGDDWNSDKELWTRFFREAGSTVYHDYEAFKRETRSGVFVFTPKLNLDIMRTTRDVRELLWRSYNFFNIGYDSQKSFACEKLFPRGSTILMTRCAYKNHPLSAISIIKDLNARMRQVEAKDRVTWKLAAPQNLHAYLMHLYHTIQEDKIDYQNLLVAFDDFRDQVDSSGTPRAIVELSTAADEDEDIDGSGIAIDDAAADAAAIESLAVWSYRHEDGALVNRRSIVVYDASGGRRGAVPRAPHGGDPRPNRAALRRPQTDAVRARAWEVEYQNIKFIPMEEYFRKLGIQQASPNGAGDEAAASTGRA